MEDGRGSAVRRDRERQGAKPFPFFVLSARGMKRKKAPRNRQRWKEEERGAGGGARVVMGMQNVWTFLPGPWLTSTNEPALEPSSVRFLHSHDEKP